MNYIRPLLSLAAAASILAAGSRAGAQTGNVGIGTATPQSQLHTTGSVRHDTLAGVGHRLVMADSAGRLHAGNGALTNATPTAVATACAPISSLVVTGLPTAVPAGNIKVRVDLLRPQSFSLVLILGAPNGNKLALFNGPGGSLSNTVFWDSAAQNVSAGTPPYIGTYKPRGAISGGCILANTTSFNNLGSGGLINPNGTWTISALNGSLTPGLLRSWSISFDGSYPPVANATLLNNIVPKGSGGKLVDGSIYDAGGKIGIDNPSPNGALEFSRVFNNRKIVLYQSQNNDHQYFGFGANDDVLRYQTDTTTSDHVFYAAASATTSNELMRIKGTGGVEVAGIVTAESVKLATPGGTPSSLNHYEETTFTASFGNAVNTFLSNQSIKIVRVGAQVTLTIPTDLLNMAASGLPDIILTTVPARFRPATNLYVIARVQSAGVPEVGTVWIKTDGSIVFRRATQAAYVGGNCGVYATSLTYSVQ